MKEIIAEKNEKLIKLLLANGFSYGAVQKALRKRDIKVAGKRVGADIEVKMGETVAVYSEPSAKKYCEIIYEDSNILAVYKYSGVTSEELFGHLLSKYGGLGSIHRLDRNTDGVMVFSLNNEAKRSLLDGFKKRAFVKIYVAEVYGRMPSPSGELVDYLTKDAENAVVSVSSRRVQGAAKIVTRYKVLEERSETSIVAAELVTGKTHQIRAHFAHYGHFVIGDGKYGKESINRRMGAKTQRLTAQKLILKFADGKLKYLDGKILEAPYAAGRIHT